MNKMKDLEINKVIVKFLNREASVVELDYLEKLLIKNENTDVFNRFVEIEFLTIITMEEFDLEKAKELIKARIKKAKRRKKLINFRRIAAAASILLIVSLSIFKVSNVFESSEEIVTIKNVVDTGGSKTILTLDNGNQISLEKDKKYLTEEVKGDGKKLLYVQVDNESKLDEIIKYNYLTVPRGGEYSVVLEDGTKVQLNSDSKLRYPEKFIDGKSRDVELLYGEAYFEVSASSKHNGSTFNVISGNQNVQVLGTQFNIKAYKEDSIITTTLVEGKVLVQKGKLREVLKPSQQSIIGADSDSIIISMVDVSKEIAWVNGLFSFEEKPLDEMMKVLSRWYAAEIIFENANQKQFVFTGVLERTKSIENILKIIKETSKNEINFEINENKIIIK